MVCMGKGHLLLTKSFLILIEEKKKSRPFQYINCIIAKDAPREKPNHFCSRFSHQHDELTRLIHSSDTWLLGRQYDGRILS
jgi:hypothetical protein